MREIKEVIEKVIAYEAYDGRRFTSQEECEKYEGSAEFILKRDYEKHVIATTNEYDLYDFGCEDSLIDILRIETKEDLDEVNRYIYFCNKDNGRLISESYIGRDNILLSYEHYNNASKGSEVWEFYYTTTLEDYFDDCRKRLQKALDNK